MGRKSPEEAQETRRKLIESALDTMSENSFSSVTMVQIANKIGLSKGAIYWHFKGKDDLLISLIEHYCGKMREIVIPQGMQLDSLSDLRTYYSNKLIRLAQSESCKKMSLLIQREWEWPDQAKEKIVNILKEQLQEEESLLESLFVKLQSENIIREERTPRELAETFVAIFHGLFSMQMHGCCSVDMERSIQFLFNAFEKELRQEADLGRDGVEDNGII